MKMTNKIKTFRAMHEMTQEQLANKVGVTRQTIIAIEKGKYTPSLELAFKISRVFNENIENVFFYTDPKKKLPRDKEFFA